MDEGLSLKYVQQALVNEEQKMRARERGHSSGADTPKDDSALVEISREDLSLENPSAMVADNPDIFDETA